jgi:hypothetical protein
MVRFDRSSSLELDGTNLLFSRSEYYCLRESSPLIFVSGYLSSLNFVYLELAKFCGPFSFTSDFWSWETLARGFFLVFLVSKILSMAFCLMFWRWNYSSTHCLS